MVQTSFYRLPVPTGGDARVAQADLERLVSRLQQTIVFADAAQEKRYRRSRYERDRVRNNVAYARALLLRQEQDALGSKGVPRKHELQKTLLGQRNRLLRIEERLQEYEELGDGDLVEDTSDNEDLLDDDIPLESSGSEPASGHASNDEALGISTSARPANLQPSAMSEQTTSKNLRKRQKPSDLPSSTKDSSTSGMTTSAATNTAASSISPVETTTDTLLNHNRFEQEQLTSSMVSMATALKQSSLAFAASLDDEKGVLDAAVDGMDRNESGMEAARRRMGLLRTYSEGKGWWGRMMLYAWIAGLWMLSVLIVFGLPKLRF